MTFKNYKNKQMKKLKLITKTLIVLFALMLIQETISAQSSDEYVYVSVSGRLFSKKLNVVVDFGDSPEQIIKSEKYTEILTGRKSYIGVLNYMSNEGYELIETMTFTYIQQGTGGTRGLGFILKQTKE